ncbi:calcium-binding protein [Marinobacterium arenosum]|uniref:calcium-binding protein n=1 Tax=Marinobacterium arenosum TaxID=2862496 RepID=UPI001C93DAC2|nr:hypothetical protein [Marinobacterium arenosum]MBY4676225.1 hypothetical protein [Marinobacterium arenosum]
MITWYGDQDFIKDDYKKAEPLLAYTMYGGGGNDYLEGADYQDFLHGETDDDTLVGNGGDDYLYGESGNDLIFGGDGQDHIVAITMSWPMGMQARI